MSRIALTEFADQMNELMPGIIKEFSRRQANELYRGKITLPQFLILDSLNKEGELKMTDLANFMQVTTSAMTGIIDRLVREGYAERAYDQDDRRIIRMKLTPKGSSLVKKVNQQRLQMIINIFGKVSQEEREDYLNILMHISEILKEHR